MPRVEQPVTLMQAHEVLIKERPGRDAPKGAWLAYYRRSAAVYAEVAEVGFAEPKTRVLCDVHG